MAMWLVLGVKLMEINSNLFSRYMLYSFVFGIVFCLGGFSDGLNLLSAMGHEKFSNWVGICVWLQLFKPKMDRVFVEGNGVRWKNPLVGSVMRKLWESGDCRVFLRIGMLVAMTSPRSCVNSF